MKKFTQIIICCLLLFCFCACSAENTEPEDATNSNTGSLKDFELLLHSDKSVYKTTDAIEIWAELVYTGENNDITIWSGDPYISFSISDGEDVGIGSAHWLMMKETVLVRGVLYRSDYVKSSFWYEEMPNADFWKEFMEQKELFLPAGKYTITAEGEFTLSNERGAEYSGPSCQIEIEVVE